MEWLKLLGVFELGALCGVIIMCIIQGGRYMKVKRKNRIEIRLSDDE